MGAEVLDVLVVGGGVVGAGSALDAAARGLATGLVEKADFASGTSSRSSRLAHGGLRYLEHREFGLVTEALRERRLLLETICPHLARPVTFLLPLARPLIDRVYMGAGVALYDLLAAGGGRGLGRHRHLSRAATLDRFPALDPAVARGGITYNDAQIDDARHTLALVRTAAARGAAVAAYTELVDLRADGHLQRATLRDRETDERIEVRARRVIIAAGVWSPEAQSRLRAGGGVAVQAAKGVHLVVPRERIAGEGALISRTRTSVLLILPWGRHWLIGTTDTAWNSPPDLPVASGADVDYLLGVANRVLATTLTRDDIAGVYAGLRPLLKDDGDTSTLSREHVVREVTPGVVVVAGGKYTTYRVMAADAVDAAAESLGAGPSTTGRLPLVGASLPEAVVAELTGEGRDEAARLARRYGAEAALLAPALSAAVGGGATIRSGEVAWACRHEGALHLDDVMRHRTRISIESGDRGLGAASAVADEMAEALGWDPARRASELARFRAGIIGERAAETAPGDALALAAYASST